MKEKLLKAIDSVLAPAATPEQEAKYKARMAMLSPDERERMQLQWKMQYEEYRQKVLFDLLTA